MDFRHELVIPNEDLPFRMFIFEGKNGNYKVSKHWHHSLEIFLVLNGEIDFFINSHHHILKQNNFVIVNSNEIHSIDCPQPNLTIVIQIPVDSFCDYMNEEPYINFEKKEGANHEKLIQLISQMFNIYELREYGYELMVRSHFFQLLYLLVTEYRAESMDEEIVRQKKHLDRLSGVTQYMKDHYQEPLTLELVADRFGFTPTYLSRIFQKYAKVNYRTYLIDLRVKYAVRELMNTDHRIGDIALDHGFPDSRAFTKAFKKRYGYLPSDYRNK